MPTVTVRTAEGERDFAALKRRVAAAGLLERQPGYYARQTALTLGLLAAAWGFVAWAPGPAARALGAVGLGVAFSQVGLLAHDAAHKQIFARARWNRAFALFLFDFAVGLSLAWWLDKHDRHHAHPNQLEVDPDVAPVVLAFCPEQARAIRGWRRHLVRRQASLFAPLLLLEGFNLRFQSLRTVWRGAEGAPRLEALAMTLHFALYLGVLTSWFGPAAALVFIVIHHMTMGVYLGGVFAPNHIGMDVLPARTPLDFLRRQVTTSRNVIGGPWVDFAFGGLNHQIEHHLFPSMPRNRLATAAGIVRPFCAGRGIPYRETGVLAAYAEALRDLQRVGEAVRDAAPSTAADAASTIPRAP